ncbi:MAG: hypothetical protein AAFY08_12955 [Planctomycetota bacterium]
MTPYRITTLLPFTGTYTPHVGCPSVVCGLGGLRRALRRLRELGYEARRGDYWCRVERIGGGSCD